MKFNLMDLMNDKSKSKESAADQAEKFEIAHIDIEKLVPSEKNEYNVRDTESLKASIDLMGLQQNLLVRPIDNGRYEVISGHRRLKAISELAEAGDERFKQAPCKVIQTEDDIQAELQLLLANSTTRELTDYEKTYQAQRIYDLLHDLQASGYKIEGRKREAVAQLMGVSPSQVARMESINRKLEPELKEAFAKEEINITTAYEMSRLPKEEQQEMFESERLPEVTPAEVQQRRKELEEPSEQVTVHEIKIHPEYFQAVKSGIKRFEYRFDDRGYEVGDILQLQEWRPEEQQYTGRELTVTVTYLLGVPDGYVIMSIKR